MTREEAKAWLEHHFDPIPDGTKQSEAVSLAIKALEQEPVLDKIRADIEQEQDDFMDDKDYDEGVRFGLMLAYQIIDKYTADSEGF